MGVLPLYLLQVPNRNDVENPPNTLKRTFDESGETYMALTLVCIQRKLISVFVVFSVPMQRSE